MTYLFGSRRPDEVGMGFIRIDGYIQQLRTAWAFNPPLFHKILCFSMWMVSGIGKSLRGYGWVWSSPQCFEVVSLVQQTRFTEAKERQGLLSPGCRCGSPYEISQAPESGAGRDESRVSFSVFTFLPTIYGLRAQGHSPNYTSRWSTKSCITSNAGLLLI